MIRFWKAGGPAAWKTTRSRRTSVRRSAGRRQYLRTIQAGVAKRVEEREVAEAARKTDGGGVREDDGGG